MNSRVPPKNTSKPKHKTQGEPLDKEDHEPPKEQKNVDIDGSKKELSIEEQVLKKILNEWQNLDERFTPEYQNKLYRDTFQRYQSKQIQILPDPPNPSGFQLGSSVDQEGKAEEVRNGAIRIYMNKYRWSNIYWLTQEGWCHFQRFSTKSINLPNDCNKSIIESRVYLLGSVRFLHHI